MDDLKRERETLFFKKWQLSYAQIVKKIAYFFRLPLPQQNEGGVFSDFVEADAILTQVLWKSHQAFINDSNTTDNFLQWVLRITENACIDHSRKKWQHIPYEKVAHKFEGVEDDITNFEVPIKISTTFSSPIYQEDEEGSQSIEIIHDHSYQVLHTEFDKTIHQSDKVKFDENFLENIFWEAYKKDYITEMQFAIFTKWLIVQRINTNSSEENSGEEKKRKKKMDWSRIAQDLGRKEAYCALEYFRAVRKLNVFIFTHKKEFLGGKDQLIAWYKWILQNPPPEFNDNERFVFRREIINQEKPSPRNVETAQEACLKMANALYINNVLDNSPLFDFIC